MKNCIPPPHFVLLFLFSPPLLLLFCFRSSFSRHHYLSHLSLVMLCLFNNNPRSRNATTAAASSRRPGDEEARAHKSVYFVSILLLLLRRILRNLSKQVFLEIPFKVSSHCNRQSVVGHDWHGYFWGQVNSGPYWQQQQLLWWAPVECLSGDNLYIVLSLSHQFIVRQVRDRVLQLWPGRSARLIGVQMSGSTSRAWLKAIRTVSYSYGVLRDLRQR